MLSRGKDIARRAMIGVVEGVKRIPLKLGLSGGDLPRYKMLLIGETGSGKTSFLNFLCNAERIQAVGFITASEGFRPFNDIALENAAASKMESKTSGAQLYKTQICGLSVGVIDSPGFGDSRGLDQDKRNAQTIVDALTAVEGINCICLVINGRTSRISATLKYVLTQITAILPRVVLNNIVVVFTNATEILDVNFDVSILEQFFGQPIKDDHIFCIENPYCRYEKAKEKQGTLPQKKIIASLKKSFDEAAAMLREFHGVVSKFDAVHTNHFVVLYHKKREIERSTISLLMKYENQKRLEAEIKDTEKEVNSAANDKRLNKKYQLIRNLSRWIQVETSRHSTLCGAAGCYSNCHAPCHLDKSFDKEEFKSCASIKSDGNCKECGHSYRLHYHDEVMHELVTEEKEMIDEATRGRFLAAETMEERQRIALAGLQEEREKSIEERKALSEQLHETIIAFEKLGISRNYCKLLENQIALIDHRLQGEVGEAARDLQEVKEKLEKQLEVVRDAVQ
jgi:GTP-binding protein EngB required for normal cell division